MQIQSRPINNDNTQFKGKVTVYGKKANFSPYVTNANKYIPESADKVLYSSFVRLLGENVGKHCTSCGSQGLNKQAMREFIGFVNILFAQHRPIITSIEESLKSKIFDFFYTTDGKGNLRYEISVKSDNDSILKDFIVEHELHLEGY